jgi:hypothetical protein
VNRRAWRNTSSRRPHTKPTSALDDREAPRREAHATPRQRAELAITVASNKSPPGPVIRIAEREAANLDVITHHEHIRQLP